MTLAACCTCGTSLSAVRRRGACNLSGRRPGETGCPGERGGEGVKQSGAQMLLGPVCLAEPPPLPLPHSPTTDKLFRPYPSPQSPTTELNAEEVQAQTDEFFRRVYKLSKQYREDLVVAGTKEMVEAFRHLLPLVTEACNPAMQPHHWEQVRGGGYQGEGGGIPPPVAPGH